MKNKIIRGVFFLILPLLFMCNNPSHYEPTLTITILGPKEAIIRDSILLEVKTDYGFYENDMLFCWKEENSNKIDTLLNPYYKYLWNFPDTGNKKIYSWIIKNGKRCSEIDSIIIRVICFKPEIKIYGDSSIFCYEKSTFKAKTKDKDGFIDKYEWILDNNIIKTISNNSDSFCYVWDISDTGLHKVKAIAIDNDGLKSEPDSLIIKVIGILPPFLKIVGNNIVSPLDTVVVISSPSVSTKKVEKYLWSYDENGVIWFSTTTDTLKKTFLTSTSKSHTIRSKILYSDGILSPADSITIFISVNPPKIILNRIEKVYTEENVKILATVTNPDGYYLYYQWEIEKNDSIVKVSTDSPYVNFIWSKKDTGYKQIVINAIDKDSLFSIKDSLTLKVFINAPVLIPLSDTMVSFLDTLYIERSFIDSTTKSLFYYWDIGFDGWDDTTVIPEYSIVFKGEKRVPLVTKVIDIYNREFCDTTYITFNFPPVIDSFSLKPQDTIWLSENYSSKDLTFNCKVSDSDSDSLSVFLLWGKEKLDTFFMNSNKQIIVSFDTIGNYKWNLIAKDTYGHLTQKEGNVIVGREHTICFAGHSYCTGDGDTSGNGGFRFGVISALRDSIGEYERVKAIGPFVSGGLLWKSPADDSCFAISGSTAREMQMLLGNAFKTLSADIWVVMFGVNGSFDNKEKSSTFAIIKEFFKRNPSARLYFILSPPFSSSTNSSRRWFNREVKDTIDSLYWRDNYMAFTVRGDSILSANKEDLKMDSTLTSDGLHPNTTGYMLLKEEILKVMFTKEPFVLPKRKN